MQLILISGLSGSGKSIALKALEDSGYYCLDNLPVKFLLQISQFLKQEGYQCLAISIDVRVGQTLEDLPQQLEILKQQDIEVRLLFLEAKDDTLVKRFSETRRRHPLSNNNLTVPECIHLERKLLANIGNIADRMDTSDLNPNALRAWIKQFVQLDREVLTLIFQSFGYKHGIPLDADLVFDVRCLPNPHYDPVLRPLTGQDDQIITFMEKDQTVQTMFNDIQRFIASWLPCFIRDNRSYLTVAIGCTGGQHRSVYFVDKLSNYFKTSQQVVVRHRELF